MDLPVSVRTKICIEPLADARSRLPLPLESLLRGCAVLPPRPLSDLLPGDVVLLLIWSLLVLEDFLCAIAQGTDNDPPADSTY